MIFQDFLYMTDVIETGHHYTIRVVSKEGKKELQRYTMKGLPRGITVMSIDEETNFEPGKRGWWEGFERGMMETCKVDGHDELPFAIHSTFGLAKDLPTDPERIAGS